MKRIKHDPELIQFNYFTNSSTYPYVIAKLNDIDSDTGSNDIEFSTLCKIRSSFNRRLGDSGEATHCSFSIDTRPDDSGNVLCIDAIKTMELIRERFAEFALKKSRAFKVKKNMSVDVVKNLVSAPILKLKSDDDEHNEDDFNDLLNFGFFNMQIKTYARKTEPNGDKHAWNLIIKKKKKVIASSPSEKVIQQYILPGALALITFTYKGNRMYASSGTGTPRFVIKPAIKMITILKSGGLVDIEDDMAKIPKELMDQLDISESEEDESDSGDSSDYQNN